MLKTLVEFAKIFFMLFEKLVEVLSILQSKGEKAKKEESKSKESEAKSKESEAKSEESETKSKSIDVEKLNILENKSYFLLKVGTVGEFEALSEEDKKLDPKTFKEKFPERQVHKKSETKVHIDNDSTKAQEERNTRKNELLNKVNFILEKCGTSEDFERLPENIKRLDREEFKKKVLDSCGK